MLLKIVCGYDDDELGEQGTGGEGDSLCSTPSHRLSCCSFRRFVTRLTLPHRTKSASYTMGTYAVSEGSK